MPVADAQVLTAAKTALDQQQLAYAEADEQYITKLNVQHGVHKASLCISNKGAIHVQGATSLVKDHLQGIADALKNGAPLPNQLPADIDKLLESLGQRVPACDPVITAYVAEAIQCYKANALLSCSFVLGAASEKAMALLFQTFGDCMPDASHKANFESKTNNRMISTRYDEFRTRFKSCRSRPTTAPLNQDIDTLLGTTFHFYRMTRNAAGHPEVVPNLDKAVLHASIA